MLDAVPYGVGRFLADVISHGIVLEKHNLVVDEANLIEVDHRVADDCQLSVFDWFHVRSCLSEVRCGIICGTGSYSGESTKLRIPASSGIGRK